MFSCTNSQQHSHQTFESRFQLLCHIQKIDLENVEGGQILSCSEAPYSKSDLRKMFLNEDFDQSDIKKLAARIMALPLEVYASLDGFKRTFMSADHSTYHVSSTQLTIDRSKTHFIDHKIPSINPKVAHIGHMLSK